MNLSRVSRLPLATVTAIWGLTVGIGFLALEIHGNSPGLLGAAVERWPAHSRVPLAAGRPTMVVAAHPLCPCTRATVAELARTLSRCEGKVEVYILILLPDGAGNDWGPADGLRRLGTIAGVHLVDDPAGEEAARFGARTSGLVALYAPDRRLLFRGGITGSRGHEGNNAGARALLSLIQNKPFSNSVATPVFGCPLFSTPSILARSETPWKK